MSWSSRKKKEGIFLKFILSEVNFFKIYVFYFNVQYIKYTFRIYILLHIKKHYFIHFCCLFLKSSKAFSVSLMLRVDLAESYKNDQQGVMQDVYFRNQCFSTFTACYFAKYCVKSICIRSYSGPHFPAFRLNTPYLSVFSPNAGKCGPV